MGPVPDAQTHSVRMSLFGVIPESGQPGRWRLIVGRQRCGCARRPVARGKIGGPSTTLVFLGIELDTVAGVLRLPHAKLQRLREEIRHWQARRAGTKRELLSLIGLLQHAASVVPAGRSFTRRLIDASKSRRQLAQYVRLNAEARADLQWWSAFLKQWNGRGFFATLAAEPRFVVGTDASGSWGCGAVWASHWFCWAWSAPWAPLPIAPKELLPVVLAAAVWGESWSGASVLLECDNTVVVAAVRSGVKQGRGAYASPAYALVLCGALWVRMEGATYPGRTEHPRGRALAQRFSHHAEDVFSAASRRADADPGTLLELVTPPGLP